MADKILVKRTWVYVHKPAAYEVRCDNCGGSNIAWSEYEGHIWCFDCEIDTVGDKGIFDGPIPVGLCKNMGISFDRIDLETKRVQVFNPKTGEYADE